MINCVQWRGVEPLCVRADAHTPFHWNMGCLT